MNPGTQGGGRSRCSFLFLFPPPADHALLFGGWSLCIEAPGGEERWSYLIIINPRRALYPSRKTTLFWTCLSNHPQLAPLICQSLVVLRSIAFTTDNVVVLCAHHSTVCAHHSTICAHHYRNKHTIKRVAGQWLQNCVPDVYTASLPDAGPLYRRKDSTKVKKKRATCQGFCRVPWIINTLRAFIARSWPCCC